MKKILYAASSYGHLKSFHVPYIKALIEQGWEVDLAAAGDSRAVKEAIMSALGGTDIQRSSKHGETSTAREKLKFEEIGFEKKMFSPRNLICVIQLRKLIKQGVYDVISVHTSLAAFFVRLAVMLAYPFEKSAKASAAKTEDDVSGEAKERPKVINTVHGYLFDEKSPKLKKLILLWAEKITKCVTDTIVVMNEQDYQIAEKYKLYKRKLVKINGYGIDTGRFTPAGALKVPKLSQTFKLIYAAEFSKRKNQKFLIRAMEKLPENIVLQLAGKGELLEECKTLAEELGLHSSKNTTNDGLGGQKLGLYVAKSAQTGNPAEQNTKNRSNRVEFLGHVTNLEEYYQKADICVSSSRSEGLPFNVMEAMAAGLPAISSRVKGHEDLIEEGVNGYLYEFDDEDEFAEAVNKMISEMKSEDWAIRKQQISQRAKKYDLEQVKEEVLEVYGE